MSSELAGLPAIHVSPPSLSARVPSSSLRGRYSFRAALMLGDGGSTSRPSAPTPSHFQKHTMLWACHRSRSTNRVPPLRMPNKSAFVHSRGTRSSVVVRQHATGLGQPYDAVRSDHESFTTDYGEPHQFIETIIEIGGALSHQHAHRLANEVKVASHRATPNHDGLPHGAGLVEEAPDVSSGMRTEGRSWFRLRRTPPSEQYARLPGLLTA